MKSPETTRQIDKVDFTEILIPKEEQITKLHSRELFEFWRLNHEMFIQFIREIGLENLPDVALHGDSKSFPITIEKGYQGDDFYVAALSDFPKSAEDFISRMYHVIDIAHVFSFEVTHEKTGIMVYVGKRNFGLCSTKKAYHSYPITFLYPISKPVPKGLSIRDYPRRMDPIYDLSRVLQYDTDDFRNNFPNNNLLDRDNPIVNEEINTVKPNEYSGLVCEEDVSRYLLKDILTDINEENGRKKEICRRLFLQQIMYKVFKIMFESEQKVINRRLDVDEQQVLTSWIKEHVKNLFDDLAKDDRVKIELEENDHVHIRLEGRFDMVEGTPRYEICDGVQTKLIIPVDPSTLPKDWGYCICELKQSMSRRLALFRSKGEDCTK